MKIKILVALILAIVTLIPNNLLADDSDALQMAPLNTEFVEYQQQQVMKMAIVSSQETNYGYIPSSVGLDYIESSRPKMLGESFPVTFSWITPLNRVTSVKDQSSFCGTCWAHGNIAVMESKVWIDGLSENQDYSEQSLVCCADTSFLRCGGGNDFMAQDTLIKKGVSLEACQPYNLNTINTQGCIGCPIYQTTNFVWVAAADNTTEAVLAIKSAIQSYGPVTVSYFNSSSNLYSDNITNNVYYYEGSSIQNHLVSIIGWDDTIPHPFGDNSGAWLAKNSWGTTWGNDGYFWMCYGKSNASEFGSLRAVKAYDINEKIYSLDESGWGSGWYNNFGLGDDTAWAANKFTSSNAGNLTHIDFYTAGINTQYDIRVYDSGDINNLGDIKSQKVGTCGDAPGYYSILLDTPVSIMNQQDFIVVAKLTTPGYNYPIPVERSTNLRYPPIQTNVSYFTTNPAFWIDLGEYGMNVCLRARIYSVPESHQEEVVTLTTNVTAPVQTIGFSVDKTSLNFGDVIAGSCSASQNITVTNIGDVSIIVTITPSGGFYTNSMKIGDILVPTDGWKTTNILAGDNTTISAKVCPLVGVSGIQSGTLTFMAEYAP